ncbi:hypothetical protein SCP_0501590 [Sparassis crispa]|uniref:Cyclin-like domain-containing protein n=1 Tax=Sparassis crispa TaxID=139825 RepID=A0A401GLR6_9APHY|nr:hypothetical protein SCP_0501590 [Sparassis crispa]GBE83112.1 hypothetical protein SCP_0501590 [Sparassis crispa]
MVNPALIKEAARRASRYTKTSSKPSSSVKPSSPPSPVTNIHPASRVDPKLHNPDVVTLLSVPLRFDFIGYIIDFVAMAVFISKVGLLRARSVNPSTADMLKTPAFIDFVTRLVVATHTDVATVLVALVYVKRWCNSLVVQHLSCEQVFLAAMFVASKYVDEHLCPLELWSDWSGKSEKEIKRVECQFLQAISFDVGIRDEDLLAHYDQVIYRCVTHSLCSSRPLPEAKAVSPPPAYRPQPVLPAPENPTWAALPVPTKEINWSFNGKLAPTAWPSFSPTSSPSSWSSASSSLSFPVSSSSSSSPWSSASSSSYSASSSPSTASSSSVATPHMDESLELPPILGKLNPEPHSQTLPGIWEAIPREYAYNPKPHSQTLPGIWEAIPREYAHLPV